MKPTQEQALDWAFECDFVESNPAEDVFSAIYVCCPKDIERLVILAYEAGRKDKNEAQLEPPCKTGSQCVGWKCERCAVQEWQGLTDEERQECLFSDPIFVMAVSTFVRGIENKLKEKNL